MRKKLWIPALVLVWIAVPATGAYVLFGINPLSHLISASRAQEPVFAPTGAGTLGSEREQAVRDATRRYVASHPEASAAMALPSNLFVVRIFETVGGVD